MTKAKADSPEAITPLRPVAAERAADFVARYANNIRYESTVFDLKLVFGETNILEHGELIKQHTAVTIPWAVVKLLQFYLRVNLAIHELYNGPVKIPPQQIPLAFPEPSPETIKAEPKSQQSYETVSRMRDEFLMEL